MIRILFSPSEDKRVGGEKSRFSAENFIFPELFSFREEIFSKYLDFVRNSDNEALSKIFGFKNIGEIEKHRAQLEEGRLLRAIQRYDGVAYQYLGFDKLEKAAQEYIVRNTIIFSNIFGPIGAGDLVPSYKLKQGESFNSLKIEDHYKKYFSPRLDEELQEAFVLDLRAGFYDKFYKPNKIYTTMKFLINGKVVSHYAKAYRGLILKEIAKANINSKDEFMNMNIDGLQILEIKRSASKEELVFDVEPSVKY